MATSSASKATLARRAWGPIFDFLIRTSRWRTEALSRHGLTPNDSRALWSLSANRGRTMRSLAEEWGCDASNATWIVDRLERLKLAERQSIPADRRVKLVVLTPQGVKTKRRLWDEFHTPPPEILALSRADLSSVARVMEKLVPPEEREAFPPSH